MESLAALQRGEGLRPHPELALQKPPELVTGLFFPPSHQISVAFKIICQARKNCIKTIHYQPP